MMKHEISVRSGSRCLIGWECLSIFELKASNTYGLTFDSRRLTRKYMGDLTTAKCPSPVVANNPISPPPPSLQAVDGARAPCGGVQQVSLIINQVFLTSWLQSRCRSSGKIPSTPDFKLPCLLSSSWLTPSSKPPSNLQANLVHPPT
ncbi:hypothetical protein AMECASPLE_015331 [Ameca splendens]|uniref:Uncharacterized protein n=1 Tax=Ameca splendens TaxID=208324 RepID=A0ABV0ZNG0_9TELE